MTAAYLIAAARTPIGSFLGGLSSISAPELGATAIRSALDRARLDASEIEQVIMGNVLSAGIGQASARQAAVGAGLPVTTPAFSVNMVCGSGLKAVMLADQAIRCGDGSLIVAGGMENMSAAPHLARGLRTGVKLGDISLMDSMVADGLTCAFQSCHMGMHAEHVARKFSISREAMDQYAVSSQQRAAAAIAAGLFVDEIVPVVVQQGKSSVIIEQDECPRPATTLEGLAKLRPVFDSAGAVTAGNASAISDGAAAVVVASESEASNSPWKFRILASHTSGTEPEDLFIAPVAAIQGALQIANLSINDIDLFEINEAFASQMVACVQALKLNMNRVNIRGGGISLGHPIGASGARVLVTLIHALLQTNQQRGVASLCLGGGNAVAMVIERVAD